MLSLFPMALFERRDHQGEYGTPITPDHLFQCIVAAQRPVPEEAIRAIVEPLAGTSFMRMALSALHTTFDEQAQQLAPLPYAVMPATLYLAFFKQIDDTTIDNHLKGQEALIAETALWSHLTHNVAAESIYPDARLEPGEMAFHQLRHDDVWRDQGHTDLVFTHGTASWQFFRDGSRVGHGLSIQSAYWQGPDNQFQMFYALAEGSPTGRQFFDGRLRGIAALPKELQTFKRYTNILFVSERFDFDLAVRKAPPQYPPSRR
jgi:hypothetical protein